MAAPAFRQSSTIKTHTSHRLTDCPLPPDKPGIVNWPSSRKRTPARGLPEISSSALRVPEIVQRLACRVLHLDQGEVD